MSKTIETPDVETPAAPTIKTVASLTDLPSRSTTVNIAMEDGILSFPCKALTYARWNELGRMVTDPPPPIMGGDRSGPKFNLQDPTYIMQREEAGEKRLYYRLTEFLNISIPGETIQERAQALRETLEFGIVKALAQAMQQTALTGEVSVNARAETFHPDGTRHAADM